MSAPEVPDRSSLDYGPLKRRGLMFILSSPSGAGKTTIARKLLAAEPDLAMSVSATTRPMRPGEVDGHDYYFLTRERFERDIEADAFLEYARVFDHLYGTPRARITPTLDAGQDILFDIDWQGTQQLRQRAGDDVVPVFILPPGIDELRRRLTNRATDGADVIEARMARARSEISHWDGYNYVVINDDIDRCFDEVRTILHAERLKRGRQTGLARFAMDMSER